MITTNPLNRSDSNSVGCLTTSSKLAVSFNQKGEALSFIDDDRWLFEHILLGDTRVSAVNVSHIPISLREVIYTTYLSPNAECRQTKVSSIVGKIHQVTQILANHPEKQTEKWFNEKQLHSFLRAIKGKYAFSSTENFICTYLQFINSDNSAGSGNHVRINKVKTAKKYCRRDAVDKKQTLAMPVGIASQIMGNAIQLVDDAFSSIDVLTMAISQAKVNQKKKGTDGYDSPSGIAKSILEGSVWSKHLDGNYRTQNVGLWINRTIAAAHNLIMAFTGIRVHELHRVHDGSFQTHLNENVTYHTITAETSKLSKGEDQVDTWVCAPMCERLLALIKILKSAAEIDSKSIMLTFSHLHEGGIKKNNTHYARLTTNLTKEVILSEDDYKEYCQLNRGRESDLSIGETWTLANHQWRRTFATMSLRFDLATLPALKRQFKHISLQMTEWYTNYARITRNEDTRVDAELNKLIRDVQVEMSTDVLFDAYNGDGTIAGGKGNEITTLRQNNSVPDVYRDRSAIKTMLEQGKLSLKFAGLNYCTNGYRCDQDGVVNAAFCVDCKSSIIDEAIAKKWKRLHERCVGHLEFAYDCGDVSPVSYAHFTSQIRAAEHVMDQFGMQYEKFQELS